MTRTPSTGSTMPLEKREEVRVTIHLLDPIQIGSMYLNDRLVMPPMATGKATTDTDSLAVYYSP